MRYAYRSFPLSGPLAWVLIALSAILGLVLAVWLLATAFVLALIAPAALAAYYTYLRFKHRRWRRLPRRFR